jgi:hypothetical protein
LSIGELGRRLEIDSETDDDPLTASLEKDPGELASVQQEIVGPFQHQGLRNGCGIQGLYERQS